MPFQDLVPVCIHMINAYLHSPSRFTHGVDCNKENDCERNVLQPAAWSDSETLQDSSLGREFEMNLIFIQEGL